MRPRARTLLALAAASAAIWGGSAYAASERVVCQQDPSHPSMSNCVLISPTSQSSVTGSSVEGSPNTVTYYVAEPSKRDARKVVVVPADAPQARTVAVAEEATNLSQPLEESPFPTNWEAGPQRPEVLYVVEESLPSSAGAGEVVIVPAQRLIVTSAPPYSSD